MLVDSRNRTWGLLRKLSFPLLLVTVYVVVVSWLDLQYHLEKYHFPASVVTLLGTVIGLVLAFRTNSSYARWWEARTIWGAIVNDSRTWTRQLIAFARDRDDDDSIAVLRRRMSLRQSAWCFALSRSLRQQEVLQDVDALIDVDELQSYRGTQNIPNAILQQQAQDLRELRRRHQIEQYEFVELERTLLRLTNAMGGCERIKNTPFPYTYSQVLHGMLYAFAFILPFGLLEMPALGQALTAILLAYGYLAIEQVAVYLQNPFDNQISDTPMLALSRTIEINIKEMLGDRDLPDKVEPVDGVLL